jgi:hypothetical protein
LRAKSGLLINRTREGEDDIEVEEEKEESVREIEGECVH